MKTVTLFNGEPNINVLFATATFTSSGTPSVSSGTLTIPGTASSGLTREAATLTYTGSNLNSGSSFLARVNSVTAAFTIDGRQ